MSTLCAGVIGIRVPCKILAVEKYIAFDLDTGDVKEGSPWPQAVGRMLGALSREKALAVFPTKVENGLIWVGVEQESIT